MELIQKIGFLFLAGLGYGSFLMHPLCRSEKTGGGFIKILSLVSFFSLLFAGLINPFRADFDLFFIPPILVSVLAYFYYYKHDETNWFAWALYSVFVFSALNYAYVYGGFKSSLVLFFLSSALFIGITNYLMLLGHWYLVTPKLSTDPLKRGLYIFWLVFSLKVVMVILEKSNWWSMLLTNDTSLYGGEWSFIVMTLFTRVVIGLLGLFLLSYFAYRLVKMRDTQGATGIFYVMVIFIFLGELASGYFVFNQGWIL